MIVITSLGAGGVGSGEILREYEVVEGLFGVGTARGRCFVDDLRFRLVAFDIINYVLTSVQHMSILLLYPFIRLQGFKCQHSLSASNGYRRAGSRDIT